MPQFYNNSDAMIVLMSLYNRIAADPSSTQSFENGVNLLVKQGYVTREDADFALAYMIPEFREKEINKIKKRAVDRYRDQQKQAKAIGYTSLDIDISDINRILSDTMEGKVESWKPKHSGVHDSPC